MLELCSGQVWTDIVPSDTRQRIPKQYPLRHWVVKKNLSEFEIDIFSDNSDVMKCQNFRMTMMQMMQRLQQRHNLSFENSQHIEYIEAGDGLRLSSICTHLNTLKKKSLKKTL